MDVEMIQWMADEIMGSQDMAVVMVRCVEKPLQYGIDFDEYSIACNIKSCNVLCCMLRNCVFCYPCSVPGVPGICLVK